MAEYLTADDLRVYLVDETAADNELLDAQDFKPSQITMAMKMAAAAFNDIEPRILGVTSDTLPFTEWAMLAVQEQLFRMRLNQLQRNAVEYQAGNTAYDEDNARIKNMQEALGRIGHWRTDANRLKVRWNNYDAYGDIG